MDPSDSFPGDDFGERANTELTEPDLSLSDIETNMAAILASVAWSPPIPGHGGCDDGFFVNMINVEVQQEQDPWFNLLCSYSDEHRGVEQAVTATNKHCIDGQAESGVSGIHCRNTRSGGAEGVNSSQQVSSDALNHRKDELDRFRKQNQQEHSPINHKSSEGASCSMLPEATGDKDEIQSTSDAKIDGEELESDLGLPSVGMSFCSEKAAYDFYSNYAKKAGFRVRRGKADYSGSDKSVIKGKCFLCSCQGHKSKGQIEKPTRYKRRDTRTGCEAMIKCMVNDGKWTISKVVLKHNHDLKGCLTGVQGRVEGSHATTSLSTGKIADEVTTAGERAFVSNVNHSDVSQGAWQSHPMPEFDDTQDLIDYFKSMQIEDPFFFYTEKVEAAQRMQKASHVAHTCTTQKRKSIAMMAMSLTMKYVAKARRTEEIAVAVEDSDGNEDMGQTNLRSCS